MRVAKASAATLRVPARSSAATWSASTCYWAASPGRTAGLWRSLCVIARSGATPGLPFKVARRSSSGPLSDGSPRSRDSQIFTHPIGGRSSRSLRQVACRPAHVGRGAPRLPYPARRSVAGTSLPKLERPQHDRPCQARPGCCDPSEAGHRSSPSPTSTAPGTGASSLEQITGTHCAGADTDDF